MNYMDQQSDPEADRYALLVGLSLIGLTVGAGFIVGVAVTIAVSRIAGWWG